MRYHILRFDIWLCLALSVLLAMGIGYLSNNVLMKKYEEHKAEHKVEVGEIGGRSKEDTFKAQNVEDLLSHDTFTVVSKGIEYRNKGAGYHKNYYLYALTLPSGERVAARINEESVIHEGDSIYSGNSTMPVGKIVKEDLTQDEYLLGQIEYSKPLDRKDFFVDMVGEAEIQSQESFIEGPVVLVQLLTIFITFPIFHAIGSKLGIFPYIFKFKKKKESEWE